MSSGFYFVKCPLFYLILKCPEREQSHRRFSEIATGLIPVSSYPVFSDLCVWYSHWSMDGINTHVMIQLAAQKSDGLVYLLDIATLLQKRQILLILAKHRVLGVLLHVFVIRLAGISDGKHYLHVLNSRIVYLSIKIEI